MPSENSKILSIFADVDLSTIDNETSAKVSYLHNVSSEVDLGFYDQSIAIPTILNNIKSETDVENIIYYPNKNIVNVTQPHNAFIDTDYLVWVEPTSALYNEWVAIFGIEPVSYSQLIAADGQIIAGYTVTLTKDNIDNNAITYINWQQNTDELTKKIVKTFCTSQAPQGINYWRIGIDFIVQ